MQVFDVVREQITRALQYPLMQLDQLRTKLGHLSYQEITNRLEAERVAKEHDELTAIPIQSATVLLIQLTVLCFPLLGRLFDRVNVVKPVSHVRPSVRTYVHTSVRLSTKHFFDFNEIWHVGSVDE